MAKHREKMHAETNSRKKSQCWNNALREVANLKGKDANGRNTMSFGAQLMKSCITLVALFLLIDDNCEFYGMFEVEFIDEVVKDIFRRLRISSRFPLPQLIGMEDSINFVTSWLKDVSSCTTDILNILGMGGIGKTSLSKYVYALHSHEFDTSSFIEDISRKCDEKYNGVLDVQKQLCDDISKPSSIQVLDDSIYTSMIENVVARKKVFLVLDDIGSLDQLDALLGSKGFHPGTKIIITTKDAWLTKSCSLFKTNFKPKYAQYKLEGLSKTESQKLLCYHAFMRNDPEAGYEEVSEKLVKYCDGHPMALKVLGRSLHNRDVTYWEGCIDTLKKENDSPINNVLKTSFDSLSSKNEKDLFKHIACIFVGMDRNYTITILEACDMETTTGITNLIDKCLLSIGWNNELMMHELVQEMGRFVVREESIYKPWKRSRIWGYESFKVLKKKRVRKMF
ncbi:disease resistance protein RUN1-like [Lactuca sativa]|uniref:disease resistance protein RUN1-like n=1 Tax=Lactuca sativa TaxID=4236 RepID=UPI0022AEB17C|nr:disease resistance protein RUN1-like [Lactuca sativa]